MEYGPLDIVPYQLKNKKDTPKSGPSDRCCNPFTLMMEVFLVQTLRIAPSVLYVRSGTCTTLTVQTALDHEPGSGHQKPAPLDGRAGYPGGVKSGCLAEFTERWFRFIPVQTSRIAPSVLCVRLELPDLQPDLRTETLAIPSSQIR